VIIKLADAAIIDLRQNHFQGPPGMTLLDILIHLLNFGAPALALALLLPPAARFVIKTRGTPLPWWVQVAINLIVGLGVLAAGLWWSGRDGKMQTYTVLVLAVGTSQWLLSRGWRR
jgi:hypothetical protein